MTAMAAPTPLLRRTEVRQGTPEWLELLGAQAQELMQRLFLRALRRLAST